jgi:leucyl aminopeptidase
MTIDTEHARARAEAAFKKKEEARREGQKAMKDYRANEQALREKTARLRALRLARDAANKPANPPFPQS